MTRKDPQVGMSKYAETLRRIAETSKGRYQEKPTDAKPTKEQAPQKYRPSVWSFIIFFGGILFLSCLSNLNELPIGTHCLLKSKTYAAKDLKESYEVLEKAKRANDEFGFAELALAGKAAPLDAGVACLVLDTNLWAHFASYRQIRVLTGAYMGQVFWVQQNDLKEGWPSTTAEQR